MKIVCKKGWLAACGASLALLTMVITTVRAQDFNYTNTNGTITITSYTGPGGAVSIPSTIAGVPVTSIGDWAFFLSNTVTSVVIPDSVTNIGDWSFGGCSSLGSVSIGNGVRTIGYAAFNLCRSLTRITIPDNVTDLKDGMYSIGGVGVFYYCSSLSSVTLGNSLTNIGESAFWFCASLTNITIPRSVVSIGAHAFESCSSLQGLYFLGNAPKVDSGIFGNDNPTVFYSPGTSGWTSTFGGRPAVLWNPMAQTRDGSFGVRQNRFGFDISGTADIPLVVETTTDLTTGPWVSLQSSSLTNGLVYFSDPQWTNYPRRFYRIRSP